MDSFKKDNKDNKENKDNKKKNVEKDLEEKEVNDKEEKKVEEKEVLEENEEISDSPNDEITSLKNQLIRLQADFTNFRNRSRKQETEAVDLGVEKLAEKIFPVLDNFKIALTHIDDENTKKGVEMIYSQLLEALKEFNIKEIASDGEEFDPNRHYAVWAEEVEGTPSNKVIETIKTGYERNDKVLQVAMVKVSK